ncbi:hypothetical protein [Neobacillus mesonae]|uniref:hypothetical protein n=1 Tax=Neobacillus mesonae TaxID=1193713 RepID=UPI0008336D35|nr:hypothetical protein [Neobacillus mesonae]
MSNTDRISYIREYFKKQNDVVVEIPPVISYVDNMKKIVRFNGYRCGNIKFVDGKATVSRQDAFKLQSLYPEAIIHEEGEK